MCDIAHALDALSEDDEHNDLFDCLNAICLSQDTDDLLKGQDICILLRESLMSLLILESKSLKWYATVCIPYLISVCLTLDVSLEFCFYDWVQLHKHSTPDFDSSSLNLPKYLFQCVNRLRDIHSTFQTAIYDATNSVTLLFTKAESELMNNQELRSRVESVHVWQPQTFDLENDGIELITP